MLPKIFSIFHKNILSIKSKKIKKLILKIEAVFFNDSTSLFFFINDYVNYKRDNSMYQHSKDIYEYSLINNINLESFFAKFDLESRKIMQEFFNKIQYIFTHNILERKKLISRNDLNHKTAILKSINHYQDKYYLPINKYDNSIFYYKTGLKFVPDNIIHKLKGKDFIDGGAFIGDSALIYEEFFDPHMIYAFEPEKNNFRYLMETIKRNHLKKVVAENLALGERNEIYKIFSDSSSSIISNEGNQEIHMISLDDYVFKNNLNIGLIKLDVEGFSLDVLKGAKISIERDKPVLIIAIYHNGKEFFDTVDWIRNLNLDYKYIIRKLNPLSAIYELCLICWIED